MTAFCVRCGQSHMDDGVPLQLDQFGWCESCALVHPVEYELVVGAA
ncbi:MAG: hypothetical protein ACRDH8_15425 [Actinomycetota bacterium]